MQEMGDKPRPAKTDHHKEPPASPLAPPPWSEPVSEMPACLSQENTWCSQFTHDSDYLEALNRLYRPDVPEEQLTEIGELFSN